MNLLKLVLSAGPATFIDVGANIGTYTLVASEVATATVLSIEPHPSTFAMLLRNVNSNGRTNVACLHVAISDHEGQVPFTDRAGSPINRVLGSSQNGETCIRVPCRTLDRTCREFKIQPDIVKVDVERHEGRVLAGFRQFLPRTKLLLIEGGEQPDARSILNAAGFLGPVYFHFTRRTFLSFPQRRAEDPVYVNQRHVEEFKGMGIDVGAQVSGKGGARLGLK
jgi:FkbM family methyltransferase